jgi:hypothetical protein
MNEIGGYTGEHLWMIVVVFGFNLVCLLLWFLLGALRRSLHLQLAHARTFVTLVDRQRAVTKLDKRDSTYVDEALKEIAAQLDEAERLGPLWGRRSATLARVSIAVLAERVPKLTESVLQQMERA